MAWLALETGIVIDQTYEIQEVLGTGGFGITYRAIDRSTSQLVAIKEYFPRSCATREGTAVYISAEEHREMFDRQLMRFWEEAGHLNRFAHPHIVKLLRRLTVEGSGTAYIVLEYIEGKSLEAWCVDQNTQAAPPPASEELEAFTAALVDALYTVHLNGILHRDIAPKNILLRNGLPVLIDFGSAREHMNNKQLTAMVSAHYAPYEQYLTSGNHQGAWTDIYGAAATIYRLIAGRPPMDAVTRSVDDSQHQSLADLGKGRYRRSFLEALDWALEVDYRKRPQSIAAWRGPLLNGVTTSRGVTGLSTVFPTIPHRPTITDRFRNLLGYNS